MTLIIIIVLFYAIGKIVVASHKRARQAEEARQRRIEILEKVQARQAKEQEKLKKEQERQRAQLLKHEKRLADLEQKMNQAEADIEHWTEQVCNLYGLLDLVESEQSSAVPGSSTDVKCQKRIIALNNQIHAAEAKLSKAKHTRQTARKELSAA